MNVLVLNKLLLAYPERIVSLLEHIGSKKISVNKAKQEIRGCRPNGANSTSLWISLENLYTIGFSEGYKGSLYGYLMRYLKLTFPQTLKWIVQILRFDDDEIKKVAADVEATSLNRCFSSWCDKYRAVDTENIIVDLPVYSESILDNYPKVISEKFLHEGITCDTQELYQIHYDPVTDRILIPQWNTSGELVGIHGRSNNPHVDYKYRWLPIIPFPTAQVVFGYHQNYTDIQNANRCYVVESAKGVMQFTSKGIYNVVALNGCSISQAQALYLKALNVDEIVLGLDHGLSKFHIISQANKLKQENAFLNQKIGYIFDGQSRILKDKESPADLDLLDLTLLLDDYICWL